MSNSISFTQNFGANTDSYRETITSEGLRRPTTEDISPLAYIMEGSNVPAKLSSFMKEVSDLLNPLYPALSSVSGGVSPSFVNNNGIILADVNKRLAEIGDKYYDELVDIANEYSSPEHLTTTKDTMIQLKSVRTAQQISNLRYPLNEAFINIINASVGPRSVSSSNSQSTNGETIPMTLMYLLTYAFCANIESFQTLARNSNTKTHVIGSLIATVARIYTYLIQIVGRSYYTADVNPTQTYVIKSPASGTSALVSVDSAETITQVNFFPAYLDPVAHINALTYSWTGIHFIGRYTTVIFTDADLNSVLCPITDGAVPLSGYPLRDITTALTNNNVLCTNFDYAEGTEGFVRVNNINEKSNQNAEVAGYASEFNSLAKTYASPTGCVSTYPNNMNNRRRLMKMSKCLSLSIHDQTDMVSILADLPGPIVDPFIYLCRQDGVPEELSTDLHDHIVNQITKSGTISKELLQEYLDNIKDFKFEKHIGNSVTNTHNGAARDCKYTCIKADETRGVNFSSNIRLHNIFTMLARYSNTLDEYVKPLDAEDMLKFVYYAMVIPDNIIKTIDGINPLLTTSNNIMSLSEAEIIACFKGMQTTIEDGKKIVESNTVDTTSVAALFIALIKPFVDHIIDNLYNTATVTTVATRDRRINVIQNVHFTTIATPKTPDYNFDLLGIGPASDNIDRIMSFKTPQSVGGTQNRPVSTLTPYNLYTMACLANVIRRTVFFPAANEAYTLKNNDIITINGRCTVSGRIAQQTSTGEADKPTNLYKPSKLAYFKNMLSVSSDNCYNIFPDESGYFSFHVDTCASSRLKLILPDNFRGSVQCNFRPDVGYSKNFCVKKFEKKTNNK